MSSALDPQEYDKGRIEPSSTLKVPVPLPRAQGSLFAELAELTGAPANPVEPPKDILEIGKLIASTSTNPAQKHWLESHVNSLTKIRMIAITRPSGLNDEETKLEKVMQ